MKTIAYVRVSKDSQDVRNQRLAILEFAQQTQLVLSEFMELSVSSRRSPKERQIDLLLTRLEAGDTLVVSEVSRMGRSVGGNYYRDRCLGEAKGAVPGDQGRDSS